MTDQNPAGLLREVARLLRDRANAATPGRWSEMHLGSEGCIVVNDGKLRDRKRVARFGWKEWKADHADAAYVASMQPAVALALADWLEATASNYEGDLAFDVPEGPCCAEPSVCGGHAPEWACDLCAGPIEGGECSHWTKALAVARSYLGTEEK